MHSGEQQHDVGDTRSAAWTKAAQALGTLLTVAAVAFLFVAFLQTGTAQSEVWNSWQTWVVVGGLGLLYGAVHILGYFGSVTLLRIVCERVPKTRHLVKIHGIFHLLKYLPTNVVHYVGRYAMLRRLGVATSAIAWFTFAEAMLVSFSAAAIAAIFGLGFLRMGFSLLPAKSIWVLVAVLLTLCAGALIALRMSRSVRQLFTIVRSKDSLRAMALTWSIYGLTFVGMGLTFWLMAQLLPGDLARPNLGTSIGALTTAWLLGFITPGAPAGFGIRETILILTLGSTGISLSDGVLLSTLYRVVTIAGDAMFAGGSYLVSHLTHDAREAVIGTPSQG